MDTVSRLTVRGRGEVDMYVGMAIMWQSLLYLLTGVRETLEDVKMKGDSGA